MFAPDLRAIAQHIRDPERSRLEPLDSGDAATIDAAADELERLAEPRPPREPRSDRLRELADELHPAAIAVHETLVDDVREALRVAADDLESLEHDLAAAERGRDFYSERLATAVLDGPQLPEQTAPATGRPLVDALEVLAALELHGEQHAPAGTDRGARAGTHAGGLRAAGAIVRSLAGLDDDNVPLAELGRELAGDAGVAVPMPQPRRFAAWLADGWDPPSPGSFVFMGPALAVWRVVGVEAVPREGAQPITTHDSEDGQRWPVHLLLEAVDAHDVPTTSRVAEVPLPVVEVPDGNVGAGPGA